MLSLLCKALFFINLVINYGGVLDSLFKKIVNFMKLRDDIVFKVVFEMVNAGF